MKFNKLFDHTLLKQEATSQEIVKLCGEAKEAFFSDPIPGVPVRHPVHCRR